MTTSTENRLQALEKQVAEQEKRLTKVEQDVSTMLIKNVQTDVASGMKSKDVAKKHSVPPMFVSSVAPRKQFAPSPKFP